MKLTLQYPLVLLTVLALASTAVASQAREGPKTDECDLVTFEKSDSWEDYEQQEDEPELGVDQEEPGAGPAALVPPPVLDRPLGLNPLRSAEPVGRLAGDLNLHLGEIRDDLTAFVASPVMQARFPVGAFEVYGSGFELGVELPLLWISPWSDPLDQLDGTIGIGNPMFSAHFIQALEDASYSLGFGVGIPLASEGGRRGPSRALGYEAAIGNRSGHDMWLWTPERLTVVLPARYEAFVDRFVLGVDGALGAMIHVGTGSQDTDYVTQLGGEMAYQVTPVSMIGVRALAHWAPGVDTHDFAFGLEPGFRAQFGDGRFLGVRLTLPLTDPYGFAFERGGNYALSFTIGQKM